MALFGKKRDKTLDLTERYRKQQERLSNLRENARTSGSEGPQNHVESSGQNANGFGFLDNVASSSSYSQSQETYTDLGNPRGYQVDSDEKKKKLAKRLMDITDKLEEISNQLYHLQQRVEVLEKRMIGTNPY